MAHEAQAATQEPQKLVIRNIGLLLTGMLENPIADADTVVAVERAHHRPRDAPRTSIRRTPPTSSTPTARHLTPGLIDSHVHPVAGDWTPRQNQIGWIDSNLNGGVTTMISAGEVHTPGRPRDIVGLKALAISAQRQFANFRPTRRQGPCRGALHRARA